MRRDPRPLDAGDQIGKYVIVGLFGLVAPAGGIALLLWMKRLVSHRVTIFDDGFSFAYGDSEDRCLWADVEMIEEVFTHEQLKVLKVPGASFKNIDRSFVVRRRGGKEYRFTVNSIDSVPRLAGFLERAAEDHGIAWERVERK